MERVNEVGGVDPIVVRERKRSVWIARSCFWDSGCIEGVYASEAAARRFVDVQTPGEPWRSDATPCKVTESRTWWIEQHVVGSDAS